MEAAARLAAAAAAALAARQPPRCPRPSTCPPRDDADDALLLGVRAGARCVHNKAALEPEELAELAGLGAEEDGAFEAEVEVDNVLVQQDVDDGDDGGSEVLLERWRIAVGPGLGNSRMVAMQDSVQSAMSGTTPPRRGPASAETQVARKCAVMLRSVISLAASLPTARFATRAGIVQRLRVAGREGGEAPRGALAPSLERAEIALPALWCGIVGVEISVNYLADLSAAGLSAPLVVAADAVPLSDALGSARPPFRGPASAPRPIPVPIPKVRGAHESGAAGTYSSAGSGASGGTRRASSSVERRLVAASQPRPGSAKSLPSGRLQGSPRAERSRLMQTRRVQILPFRQSSVAGAAGAYATASGPVSMGTRGREGLVFHAYSSAKADENGSSAPHSLPTRLTHVYFPSGRKYPSLSGPEMESMSASLQSSQQLLRSLSSLDRSMRELSDLGSLRGSDLGALSSSASPPSGAAPSKSLPEPRDTLSVGPFKSRTPQADRARGGGSQVIEERRASHPFAATDTEPKRRAPLERRRLVQSRPATTQLDMPWHLDEEEVDTLASEFLNAFGDVLARSTGFGNAPSSPSEFPFAMGDTSLDSLPKEADAADGESFARDFRALCRMSASGLGFNAGPGGLPGACSLADTEREFMRLTR